MALPFMISPQEAAVTGGAYRRRRTGDSERGLKAYLQSQVPAMRAAKERRKAYERWQAEQEQLAEHHTAEMDIRKKEIAERAAAAKEQAAIASEGLDISRKAQKEAEKQGKYGLYLQGAATALQAWQASQEMDPWDYTRELSQYGSLDYEDEGPGYSISIGKSFEF